VPYVQQLSVIDSVLLATESPRTPNHLCMVNIYDPSDAPGGRPTLDQVLDAFRSALDAVPSLRRKLVRVPFDLDRPYWVDDPDFDLEFHVRHLALPRPGDWRQLRTQVARLHSRPVDLARPPWEVTLIDGIDAIEDLPVGCFATVLKVHHAAIDGQSGVEVLNVIHDLEPISPPDQVDRPEPWIGAPLPSQAELLRRASLHAVSNPVQALRAVTENLSPLARSVADAGRKRGTAPKIEATRFNVKVSAHRTWEQATCSLADMKRIKNAVPGATINDACLSIVGGAMYAYLADLGEAPQTSLVASVPVSTRTPDQAGTGGNQISGMRVSLHTAIADPLERLAAIAHETSSKKATRDGVAMPVLLNVAEVLPGALIGAAVRGVSAMGDRMLTGGNTVVTNVPGSPVPLYFLGSRLVRSTGCVPLSDGLGLFHSVSSYAGTFIFMFTADRDLMPDPEVYRSYLERSIDAHLARSEPAKPKPSPKPSPKPNPRSLKLPAKDQTVQR
jgi:WS/DGAT/MGAT family acyltransferase